MKCENPECDQDAYAKPRKANPVSWGRRDDGSCVRACVSCGNAWALRGEFGLVQAPPGAAIGLVRELAEQWTGEVDLEVPCRRDWPDGWSRTAGRPSVGLDGAVPLVARAIVLIAGGALDVPWDAHHVCTPPDDQPQDCIEPLHVQALHRNGTGGHRELTGLELRGAQHPAAKLTEDQAIWAIRRVIAMGRRQVDVANELGVSKTTVGHLVRGKTWPHLDNHRRDARLARDIRDAFTKGAAA